MFPFQLLSLYRKLGFGCGKAVCHVSILQFYGSTTTDLHVPWGSLNLNSCGAFKEWRENERKREEREKESHIHRNKSVWESQSETSKGFNKYGKLLNESLWLVAALGKRKHTYKSSTDTSASIRAFHTSQNFKRFSVHQVFPTSLAFVHAIFTAQPPWGRTRLPTFHRMPDPDGQRPVHGTEAIKHINSGE